jgi:hypothetical protein
MEANNLNFFTVGIEDAILPVLVESANCCCLCFDISNLEQIQQLPKVWSSLIEQSMFM